MKRLLPFIFILSPFLSIFGQSKKIISDDYYITDNMFKGNYSKRSSGNIYSEDKAWFTNDTLKQTLVFELYTDYHRFFIYHFYNNDIPSQLIDCIDLSFINSQTNSSDTASSVEKQKNFNGFLKFSKKIDQKYFKTKKGFILGSSKKKAITEYGKPDTSYISKTLEICEWHFEGDYKDEETPLVKSDNLYAKTALDIASKCFLEKKNW